MLGGLCIMLLLRHWTVHAQGVHHSLLLVAHSEDVQKYESSIIPCYCLPRTCYDHLILRRSIRLLSHPLQLVIGL